MHIELKLYLPVTVLLFLLATSALGGDRGPGKYAGIVIFDRWDTCYLYSGTYLMHISDKTKEVLRVYEGKSILIDAKEVFQPINPGDGLITKFEVLGDAETKTDLPELRGLKLVAIPAFGNDQKPRFRLEIENQGKENASFTTENIAPTLLGLKNP